MNVDAYLQRIGYTGSRTPGAGTLASLHEAHLRRVPFENLDIHRGVEIVLEAGWLFDKIVTRRRGGFCYELNGLLALLLEALGFSVQRLSARVIDDAGGVGPEFDHLALMVELEERWLADVGFGDSFLRPLRLDERGEQVDPAGVFRLASQAERWWLESRDADGTWRESYRFTMLPRTIEEFAPMCRWQQTSPDSHFTKKTVCTLPTPTGRVTLSGNRLITTERNRRDEAELADEAQIQSALQRLFGIDVRP